MSWLRCCNHARLVRKIRWIVSEDETRRSRRIENLDWRKFLRKNGHSFFKKFLANQDFDPTVENFKEWRHFPAPQRGRQEGKAGKFLRSHWNFPSAIKISGRDKNFCLYEIFLPWNFLAWKFHGSKFSRQKIFRHKISLKNFVVEKFFITREIFMTTGKFYAWERKFRVGELKEVGLPSFRPLWKA